MLSEITTRKWIINISIKVQNEFVLNTTALFDTGADLNCIKEGLIPTKYFEKTYQSLKSASGDKLNINFKLPEAEVVKDQISFKTPFLLVKNIKQNVILGSPFINLLQPFKVTEKGIETKTLGKRIVSISFLKLRLGH